MSVRRSLLTATAAAVCIPLATFCLSGLVAPAAQPLENGSAPAARGNVNVAASRAYVLVGKTGFGHEHGVEGRLSSGHINLGASENAGQLVFDMRTFDADTAAARRYVGLEGTTSESTRRQVNANMQGPAVLDVRRYPTATFRINSAQPLSQASRRGHRQYRVAGDFTLHGVSRPVQFTAEAVPQQGSTRLRGGFVIQQTHFGIKPFSKAFGAIGVADQLTIYGELQIDKSPEQLGAKPAAPSASTASRVQP